MCIQLQIPDFIYIRYFLISIAIANGIVQKYRDEFPVQELVVNKELRNSHAALDNSYFVYLLFLVFYCIS